ncbi:MAG: class I SAM-dependent methyltransferase [Gemmatimonadota bacterium]|nr:MAG: class I SAM-dependent methyltransferase [Gemmatimonadota bacterium]
MRRFSRILARPSVYRVWQTPFAGKKLRPLLKHAELRRVRRVLDVGCGPGTNASLFAGIEYLGVDLNASYVEDARRRYGREFIVADITRHSLSERGPFDFIFANSVLHHIETADVRRILSHLGELLTEDGHVHVLDLVLPRRASLARMLARWDRGRYARDVEEWRSLFFEFFEPVVFEPYPLGALGVVLWNMVYFKGRAKRK